MASFFTELKRRNVLRVAVLYVAASWLILQAGEILFEILDVPEWGMRLVLALLVIGFPIAVIFSWVYEVTPEGVKRETEISHELQLATTRKLDIAVLAVVVLAASLFGAKWFMEGDEAAEVAFRTPAAGSRAEGMAEENTLAVLPFVNMSADEENEYFADGLSEELLNRLAQLPELLVIGRTSSFAFKGQSVDLREIGTKLGAANILEGSVRRQGNQLRVTAQLIRANDGVHLWSQTYDRSMENVFAVQDDIAENVAQAMDIVLDEKKRASMHAAGIRDVDAFMAYQKGYELYELAHSGETDLLSTLEQANERFAEAVRYAPEFGAAQFIQGDYYGHLLYAGDFPFDELAVALKEYRALLDAAYTHSVDAQRRAIIDVERILISDDWRFLGDRLRRVFDEAGCVQPTWLEIVAPFGYAEGVYEVYRRAWECNPMSSLMSLEAVHTALWASRPEDALEIIDAAIERLGGSEWLRGMRSRIFLVEERFAEAREELSVVTLGAPGFGETRISVESAAGNLDEARRLAEAWREARAIETGTDTTDSVELNIRILAGLGERERANVAAAAVDARAGGPALIARVVSSCYCGAPFDIEMTPNFQARLEESGLGWPPETLIHYPAKDW